MPPNNQEPFLLAAAIAVQLCIHPDNLGSFPSIVLIIATVCRVLHTLAYVCKIQPFRTSSRHRSGEGLEGSSHQWAERTRHDDGWAAAARGGGVRPALRRLCRDLRSLLCEQVSATLPLFVRHAVCVTRYAQLRDGDDLHGHSGGAAMPRMRRPAEASKKASQRTRAVGKKRAERREWAHRVRSSSSSIFFFPAVALPWLGCCLEL